MWLKDSRCSTKCTGHFGCLLWWCDLGLTWFACWWLLTKKNLSIRIKKCTVMHIRSHADHHLLLWTFMAVLLILWCRVLRKMKWNAALPCGQTEPQYLHVLAFNYGWVVRSCFGIIIMHPDENAIFVLCWSRRKFIGSNNKKNKMEQHYLESNFIVIIFMSLTMMIMTQATVFTERQMKIYLLQNVCSMLINSTIP